MFLVHTQHIAASCFWPCHHISCHTGKVADVQLPNPAPCIPAGCHCSLDEGVFAVQPTLGLLQLRLSCLLPDALGFHHCGGVLVCALRPQPRLELLQQPLPPRAVCPSGLEGFSAAAQLLLQLLALLLDIA